MKPRNSIYSFSFNMICILLLAGNIVYLIVKWGSFPEQIPMHFDAAGNITNYGGKGWLFFMPIMSLILFSGLTAVERFPQLWNTGVEVTEENMRRVYGIIKNMIVTLKLAMVAVFVFVSRYQSLSASLPGWFLPAALFAALASIVFFIVKLIRAR